jgi:hypothetical protein
VESAAQFDQMSNIPNWKFNKSSHIMYFATFRFKLFCLNYKFFRNDEKRQFYVPIRTESHELRPL